MIESLLLIGCGNMGSALLRGWQRGGIADTLSALCVIDPRDMLPEGAAARSPVSLHVRLDNLPAGFRPDVVVLAVKPQQLDDVLPACAARFAAAPLYVSIVAGKDIAALASRLGAQARIVRVMPNTPALIGEGMSVLCAGANVPPPERAQAEQLFAAVGATLWLEESLMHAATAISGSGPAYVFLFLECLMRAGIRLGLPEEIARTLALRTVAGSALLARESGEDFTTLRARVASPGGTTEAALKILQQDQALAALLEQAAQAAAKRSRELAG